MNDKWTIEWMTEWMENKKKNDVIKNNKQIKYGQ